jgi:hypothetical protein
MEEKEFVETIGELAKIIEMMKLNLQDEELATLPKTKEALERIVKDFERLKKILIEEKELMIE